MHRQFDHSTLLQLAFGELKGSLMASHPAHLNRRIVAAVTHTKGDHVHFGPARR
jgi:hypothetical protein